MAGIFKLLKTKTYCLSHTWEVRLRNCKILNFVTFIQSGKNRPSRNHKTIIIDNYEVTIFPAESVNHSHTIPANCTGYDPEMKGADSYSTWFYDLQGKIFHYFTGCLKAQCFFLNLFVLYFYVFEDRSD